MDASAAIEQLWVAGRARWPTLAVTAAQLREHLAALGASADSVAFPEDLVLACAAARGEPVALAAIEALAAPVLARIQQRWRHGAIDHDELAQALRERLFVAAPGAAPRIAQYGGQGPLRPWLRVTAARLMVDLARATRDVAAAPEDERLLGLVADDDSPELAYLKAEYRARFKVAFARALAALDADHRTVLRLRFLDGLQLDEIARIDGVHRVTVSKMLARARDALGRAIEAELATILDGDDPAAVLAMVRSRLTLSFARLLATEPGAGT